MDDIIVLSGNKDYLRHVMKKMWEYLGKLKLEIKHNYQIFPVDKRWIDFIWYRFFRDYVLLRKRTCKRMKNKIKMIIETKTRKNKLLNYSERCSLNSYVWWIIYCNHFRLYEKWIQPIIKSLNRYYYYVIINRNSKKLNRYYKNIIKKKTFIFCK